MIVLDASVLVALLSAVDAHHEDASRLLTNGAAEGFAMHSVSLAEVLVGAVRVGRANQLFADLRAMGVVQADGDPREPLILAELRATTGLKMPDCCVLAVALRGNDAVATFDQALAREARKLGLVVRPETPS